MTKDSMTADRWIEAAFRALSDGGPEAIRAEKIARDIKVSKGSFYWHFKNVDALKAAMLQHWKKGATESIVEALEASGTNATTKLRALVEYASGDANEPYGGASSEGAIRDWGRYDKRVADTVAAVDEMRLQYLDQLFEQCGAKGEEIRSNSLQLYGALIGLEYLTVSSFAHLKRDLNQTLDMLLGKLNS